jgi:hypothetical protein
MKTIIPLLFIATGSVFLLVSTVFYATVANYLITSQSEITWNMPGFWNLAFVLSFVRVIFIITGSFLIIFGIALFLSKKASLLWP